MKRFQNILYITEANSVNYDALARAANLANNNEARLTVVELTEKVSNDFNLFSGRFPLQELQEELVANRQEALENLVAPWRQFVQIETSILIGVSFLEVIRKVLRDKHDLVIKPTENALLEHVFGSNDMHLFRKCPCPVWLFKLGAPKKFRTIVAAVDVNDFF